MAELAAEAHCVGHRGELALERTARAFAALAGRLDVREEDVLEAAELALAHRRRMTTPPPQKQKEQERNERSPSQEQEQSRRETDGDEQREHSHSQEQPFDTVPQLPPFRPTAQEQQGWEMWSRSLPLEIRLRSSLSG